MALNDYIKNYSKVVTPEQILDEGKVDLTKKFKINDGSSKFVDMNTLLDPANDAAAKQHDAEEIREVSIQLAGIKKKHDDANKAVN